MTNDIGNAPRLARHWAIALIAALAMPGAFSMARQDPVPATAASTRPTWEIGPFERVADPNPVITPIRESTFNDPMTGKPVAWEHDHTFNPAAVVRDGKVCVLYRAEDNSGQGIGMHTSRLGLAVSDDGVHFQRQPAPVLFPSNDAQRDNEWTGGCEDPRLVESPDGTYVLTYTQWNRKTPRLAIATSRDLQTWTKHGPTFTGPLRDKATKSGAILTSLVNGRLIATKVNGKYWMYWGEQGLSLATSDDLIHWTTLTDDQGNPKIILPTRPRLFDSALAEGGPPAVLTSAGIVVFYNGKNATDATADPAIPSGAYCGGQALFDANDPTKLLSRATTPYFKPETPWERTGQYAAGTTFTEGLVYFKGNWFMYYGTADSFVGVAGTVRLP